RANSLAADHDRWTTAGHQGPGLSLGLARGRGEKKAIPVKVTDITATVTQALTTARQQPEGPVGPFRGVSGTALWAVALVNGRILMVVVRDQQTSTLSGGREA